MKFLIMISLIALIGCGKKIVDTKTYGGHTLITYEDGSKKWEHPEGFKDIGDLDEHKEMANEYIAKNSYEEDPGRSVTIRIIEKYNTLMGEGWIIVKEVLILEGQTPRDPIYYGLNLLKTDFDTNSFIYAEGDFDFQNVRNLIEIENGVFAIDVSENSSITGYYDRDGELGQVYSGNLKDTNLTDPITFEVNELLVGGGCCDPSDQFTPSDFGAGNLTGEDFYFSEDQDSKKDLENIASAIETEELTQYGLSTKTAKIVKTLAKTAGKRALSAREKDMFAKELTGMTFDQAAEQMVEDYEGLIEKAAELNETSPEAIKELINTIM